MIYEIIAKPTDYDRIEELIREEIEFVFAYFEERGIRSIDVMFGYGWGAEYYPTNEWNLIPFDRAGVFAELARIEGEGLGSLGCDDLFLFLYQETVEFLFCHEADIHLSYDVPTDDTEFFYQRWKGLGLKPSEWTKTEDGSPGRKLRSE